MRLHTFCSVAAALALLVPVARGTMPYKPVALPPGGFPAIGQGVILPSDVFGKEYSHDADVDVTPVLDPEQVIAWDGIGGVADGLDFTGTRPNFTPDPDVDALANHADALYMQVIAGRVTDTAHLVFSHDRDVIAVLRSSPTVPYSFAPITLPSAGPVPLSNGNFIGGAGELSREIAGAFAIEDQKVWAVQPEINGMPLPDDIDAVEVWGPEPGIAADSDRYSLVRDFISGTSVWNLSGGTYIPHSLVVLAVESALGPLPPSAVAVTPTGDRIQGRPAIDLDALMVQDRVGDIDLFESDPSGGAADSIIFSIDQIFDPADPSGYYATGAELFVLTAGSPAGPPFSSISFLGHGGHLWDKAYALSKLAVPAPFAAPGIPSDARIIIDIDAIEAIGELVAVPEPAAAWLLVATVAAIAIRRQK